MKILFKLIAQIAWGLWLGGLIALFMFVLTLFHNNHDLAVQTAPQLFHVFEIYQLVLAPIAVISSLLRRQNAMVILFALASIGAVVSTALITPRITAMNLAGQTHTPEFGKLHGESMMIYMTNAGLVLAAGIVMAVKKDRAGKGKSARVIVDAHAGI